ncbi:phosphoadenosine phosphosulfate reductase domain-containing protein [Aurantibacter aestuarii]|uniref:Phosphoadenylylsulfate reductase n=1 Tax=Aurantibacter aestuarii TaxID=1266046 RepID=A0A2T1NER5_9FLAO|nr:phosphoadenosine phosphosulfate reductase family protein [Aurantibacter aestuarii]PSG90945.1 phosphoadenylylsulfate reductase [Aurantibacter aestuarii]
MDLTEINKQLSGKSPEEIVSWALSFAKKPIITTNFRPFEAAILHLVSKKKNDINVVWCDTGYNTPQTYKHAEEIISRLQLNIDLYVPKQTVAHRNSVLGLPDVNDSKHEIFTEQVKLEPFTRAMNFHEPDVWFTNLRKGQTAFRDSIDVVSQDAKGVVKVSPFYHYTDEALEAYLEEHNLPNEFKYFDPTKVLGHRECGLHSK